MDIWPSKGIKKGITTFRSLKLNDEDLIDFSTGFDDLHIASYAAILNGQGFGLEDVRPVIQLIQK